MRPGRRRCPIPNRPQNRPICYVCVRPIRKNPVYVGRETYRHKRCKPGSRRHQRFKGQTDLAGGH